MAAARKKSKKVKGKKSKRRAGPATTRSTAGPGFNFEDQVAAWLLSKMLRGEPVPAIDVPGHQIQMQTQAQKWFVDDLLVAANVKDGASTQLAISAKSNVQVTASGLPSDFVSRAWSQWREPGPFDRKADRLALATRGRNNAFDATWSDIKNWCAGADSASALAKIHASAKHKKIFASVKASGNGAGKPANDEDAVDLVRHIEVIPLDFQLAVSHDEQAAIGRCRDIVESGTHEDAKELWEALIRSAEKARLVGGTIQLVSLRAELSKRFRLKGHPDFSASWKALAAISSDYKDGIETALPTGLHITRSSEITEISSLIAQNAQSVVYGNSGSGKSALVKSVLDDAPDNWNQVWFGPEQLDASLSEVKRGGLGLAHPLIEILKTSVHPNNVLVIDAAERLLNECATRTKALLKALEPIANWHVVIVGQTEAWADGRLPLLTSAPPLPKNHEVEEFSAAEVRTALRSNTTLAWLATHDDAVAALSNPRALAWVMLAESQFQTQSVSGAISLTMVADRLWHFWTNGQARLQNLLMRLGEREANFERSFPISSLPNEDAAAFDTRPTHCPLRKTANNRIRFEHDLAADWTRFQRLKEIADDTAQWAAFASNPLWSAALRMLGQSLLRQTIGSRTAWDVAFEAVENSQEAPLAADILLDALCLDPLAEAFLSERADFLFENNGRRINRLLRRFHHVASVAGIPAQLLQADRSLNLYFEAHYRTPILGRWLRVANFLSREKERLAKLMSSVVAKLCETWLTTTPVELAPGVPMPFRKDFAEIALASARALQVAQAQRVIFMDDSEKAIYAAAFAAAADLPDDVGAWALEMAQRRPYRDDVAQQIAAYHRKQAEEHTEKLRTDPEYRKRHKQRRSVPTFIPSGRKLPPWPLGPHGRIEKDFRECCLDTPALAHLMGSRPQIASEILLANLIEDSPEESYSSSSRLDWDLGLEFDHTAYPTAYWKSPFFNFLAINQRTAIDSLLRLIDFSVERWKSAFSNPLQAPHVTLTINGAAKTYYGDARTFDWSHENSMHNGQLHCALAALERWLCTNIDRGNDVSALLRELLERSAAVGILGVLANVGKYKPVLFTGALQPLLGNEFLYFWDRHRVQTSSLHFDALAWARAGEAIFERAKEWVFAPYRKKSLEEIAVELLTTDSGTSEYVVAAARAWTLPQDRKEALELRILVAQLDRANYALARDAKSGTEKYEFHCPPDLQHDIASFEESVRPGRQALYVPAQCEGILGLPRMLTNDEAASVAAALQAIPQDEEPNRKKVARVALAATLCAKGREWLSRHDAERTQVDDILRQAISDIPDTAEGLRETAIGGGTGELKFVAVALMEQWVDPSGPRAELDSQILRLITSRDGAALSTLMYFGNLHRATLGSRWWRLLKLAALWSGLLMLTPRFEDDDGATQARWSRWLRWFRQLKLTDVNASEKDIDLLAVARRIDRLEESRFNRAEARHAKTRRYSRGRKFGGLETHALGQIFDWLLRDQYVVKSAEDCRLLFSLWDFEVWLRYAELDEDDRDHAPPSNLGYSLLKKMASLLVSTPAEQGPSVWKPVLSLGAEAHYSIGHFISCWFIDVVPNKGSLHTAQHWRAMLEYALNTANWTAAKQWYYGESLLRQLLGFGFDKQIVQASDCAKLILGLRDLYETWATKHLRDEEDNIAGLCGFLASDAGAPIRLDGLLWIARAFEPGPMSGVHWHRTQTGSALVELLDTLVTKDADRLALNADHRQALIRLSAHLVARQVPAALALQERVARLA